jgi:hypothetical protein
MDHQQEQGDALLGVVAIAEEFFGKSNLDKLPKKEREKKSGR